MQALVSYLYHYFISNLCLFIAFCYNKFCFSFLFFDEARSYRRDTLPSDIMSSAGFSAHRQVYIDDFDSDYEYHVNDDPERQPIKPVPIWLCVFLVVSYIFGGAFLFSAWEHWPFLDSAYFCFITLTTIG